MFFDITLFGFLIYARSITQGENCKFSHDVIPLTKSKVQTDVVSTYIRSIV